MTADLDHLGALRGALYDAANARGDAQRGHYDLRLLTLSDRLVSEGLVEAARGLGGWADWEPRWMALVALRDALAPLDALRPLEWPVEPWSGDIFDPAWATYTAAVLAHGPKIQAATLAVISHGVDGLMCHLGGWLEWKWEGMPWLYSLPWRHERPSGSIAWMRSALTAHADPEMKRVPWRLGPMGAQLWRDEEIGDLPLDDDDIPLRCYIDALPAHMKSKAVPLDHTWRICFAHPTNDDRRRGAPLFTPEGIALWLTQAQWERRWTDGPLRDLLGLEAPGAGVR